MGKKKIFLAIGLITATVILSISLVTAKNINTDKEVERSFFQVENLTCGSCIVEIEKELKTHVGIVSLAADLSMKLVAIDHTPDLSKEQIAAAITKTGYTAKALTKKELFILSEKAVTAAEQQGSSCGISGKCCGGSKDNSVSSANEQDKQPQKSI